MIDPWPLFASACMQGGSTLPAGAFRESSASELPDAVRRALGANLIDRSVLGTIGVNFTVSAGSNIPNKVYAFRDGRGYVLLPTGGDIKSNAFAGMCAVAVQGDHYLAALQQMNRGQAEKLAKKVAKKGSKPAVFSDFRARSGKYDVSLVQLDGWTSAAVNAAK
jgi:hypothetical protein